MANDVSYFQIEGNPTTYSFNDADAESRIAQKVSKSGDTMTGGLVVTNNTPVTLQDTAITIGTAPSGTHNGAGVRFSDSAGTVFGYVRPTYRNDGNIGVQLYATRTVGGVAKGIDLTLLVDNDGNISVSTISPSAWRSALAVVPTARTINGYDLTTNRSLTYSDVGALSATDTTVVHVGNSASADEGSTVISTTTPTAYAFTYSIPTGATLVGALVRRTAAAVNLYGYQLYTDTNKIRVKATGDGTATVSYIAVRPLYTF